jgi:hypothetical protein
VRRETPSCSAASLLVISSRPDTLEESNSAHQRVKHWHVLAFPDTTLGECGDSSNEGIRCAVDLTTLTRKPFG